MSAATPVAAGRRKQPLEALQIPDALLHMETVAVASGLSVSTLYRKAAAGELELVRMGTRCTRVRSSVARAFIQALGASN